MRIVLVGTDLAPVRPGAGALETLLCGWASGLATDHDVTIASAHWDGAPAETARRDGAPAPGGLPYRRMAFDHTADLAALVAGIGPDVVVLNNRPGWQAFVEAPTLHLLHNWPDAWGLPDGADAGRLVAGAGLAAVSRALAATVAAATGRRAADVVVVRPFVDAAFFEVAARPEPGLVVCPSRLLVKKGVRELAAAAGHPSLRGHRVMITDHISPWTRPTAEHLELRAVVASSAAELIAPPDGPAGMAALYARAEVVVCPSIRPEGLGLTALEAQAAGVPVVSSGLGGLAEATLLPGLTADPYDPAALGAAVTAAAALDARERAALRAAVAGRWSTATSLASLVAALGRAGVPSRGVGSLACPPS